MGRFSADIDVERRKGASERLPEARLVSSQAPSEVGVRTIKWLGKRGVENYVYPPGSAYFFLPIFNDWSTFDTRLQVVEMKGPNQLTIKTRDGNDLFVDMTFSLGQ